MQALLEEIAYADFSRLSWPESGREQVTAALRFLLDGSLTLRRRERGEKAETVDLKNLAWCFVADQGFRPLPVRTWDTLEKLIDLGAIYFTANTFYSRKAKTQSALRWLNALWVDIDDPVVCDLDILNRCWELGLPRPSLVVKTPRGMHCYWKIRRVRATEKALKLYSKLLRAVAKAFEADVKAATPEHFMRIPKVILSFERIEYELKDFLTLLGDEKLSAKLTGRVAAQNILSHPAVLKLIEGVPEHSRHHACFTLARAFRWMGYSYDETLQNLLQWNQRNERGSHPHRDSEVRATVRSVYREKQIKPPAAEWVRELSGMLFGYRVFGRRSGGKPGRPRVQEAVREKFIALIQEAGGTLTTHDSRRKLAAQLGVSERTLNSVIAALAADGSITISTMRLGRGKGTETTYTIAVSLEAACSESCSAVGGGGGGESRMRRVLVDAVECCDKLIEIAGKADGADLVFFARLLLKQPRRRVFKALAALKKIKARDPTGFLVEAPRRWLTEILLI